MIGPVDFWTWTSPAGGGGGEADTKELISTSGFITDVHVAEREK